MKVDIQFIKMPVSETFSKFINTKLEKVFRKYPWIISGKVFIKQENNSKREAKICNIQLSLPGPLLFATSTQNNFELAFSETLSEVEKQLEKRKSLFQENSRMIV